MGTALVWRYNDRQVGLVFLLTSTPATTTNTVENIMFTVAHISNDNDIFISNLSFTAVMETNGQITCIGGGNNREEKIIHLGSGKDHQLCACTCS